MKTKNIVDELQERGLVQDCTDLGALAQQAEAGPITLYCGFDPTADSLHVGSLIPLICLARFQRAGHRVLALVGGATGLVGDPSGKSQERNLQTSEEVALKVEALKSQISRFIKLDNPAVGQVVNNLDWTQDLSVLAFLRDVGKHFSVNAMLNRESVRNRLSREGEGISYTEFSYMLLQAFDFLKLFESHQCTLQVGGSDQWGNMCSGADLIRRKHGQAAFALTFPLLTTSDGQKFGKSVNGAVWLDAKKTSPWEFFQFWLNTEDADVIRFLLLFTFVGMDTVEALRRRVAEQPQLREAQRRLAWEVTALVHGEAVAQQCADAAKTLFGGQDPDELSAPTLSFLQSCVPTLVVPELEETPSISQVLVKVGLEPSLTRAHQSAQAGGVSVNGQKTLDGRARLTTVPALHQSWFLVRKGKKSFALVVCPQRMV